MKKFGLALGSGGILGFAHIGVLRCLEEFDLKVDLVAGSSAGALVGASYCLDLSVDKIEEFALDFVSDEPFRLFELSSFTQRSKKEYKMKLFMEKMYLNREFSKLKLPFSAVACDLGSGKQMILNKGRISDAVFASMSVPGIYGPTYYWGKWLTDGGVVNPTPISVVQSMGSEFSLGVDLTFLENIDVDQRPSQFNVFTRAISIMNNEVSKLKSKNDSNSLILSLRFENSDSYVDQKIVKKYIKIGYNETYKNIDLIKERLI